MSTLKTVTAYGNNMRRSQQERRETTRSLLLDATVACLVERGYAGTTVGEVLDRAEVARGTLLHHFPTKTDLLVAAVGHVAQSRAELWQRESLQLASRPVHLGTAVDALVDLAWRDLSSPAFFAGLELWVAARTEPELQAALAPVEAGLFDSIRDTLLGVLGDELAADRRASTLVQFTVDLLTGLSLSTILTGAGGVDGARQLILRRWKRALLVLFGELDPAALTSSRTNRPL